MDWTDLGSVLAWLVSGGGASLAAYWLMEQVAFFSGLRDMWKRYVSFALSGSIAVGAWSALIALTGTAWPTTPEAWIMELFRVAALGIIGGQVVHAKDLHHA